MQAAFDMVDAPAVRVNTGYYLKQSALEVAVSDALEAAGLAGFKANARHFFLFDLSKTFWYDIGALLWLISLLHRLKSLGHELRLVLPERIDSKSENVWSFLKRWRFFEVLEACVDDPRNLLPDRQHVYIQMASRYKEPSAVRDPDGKEVEVHTLSLLEMQTFFAQPSGDALGDEQGRQFDRLQGPIIVNALSYICGWDQLTAKVFLANVVREGIRNSLDHAQGTFANLAFRTDDRNLIFAIADNGVGIPTVLRSASAKFEKSNDLDLIHYFVQREFVLAAEALDSEIIGRSTDMETTSMVGIRPGNGLYYLKKTVLENDGELRIRSGTARVDFTGSGERAEDNLLDSPGTLIRITAPLRGPRGE